MFKKKYENDKHQRDNTCNNTEKDENTIVDIIIVVATYHVYLNVNIWAIGLWFRSDFWIGYSLVPAWVVHHYKNFLIFI